MPKKKEKKNYGGSQRYMPIWFQRMTRMSTISSNPTYEVAEMFIKYYNPEIRFVI